MQLDYTELRSLASDVAIELEHPKSWERSSDESSVRERVIFASKLCLEDCGCSSFIATSDASERRQLWSARYQLYYALLALRPSSLGTVTDVCVP